MLAMPLDCCGQSVSLGINCSDDCMHLDTEGGRGSTMHENHSTTCTTHGEKGTVDALRQVSH
jgi:hypothetical protein